MFIPGKDTMYSCSKHNYTGLNNPCPDCKKELKEFAWEWCKRIYKATRISDIPYDETSELYLKSIFEKEWKEQGR